VEWVSVIRQLPLACQAGVAMKAELAALGAVHGAGVDAPCRVNCRKSTLMGGSVSESGMYP